MSDDMEGFIGQLQKEAEKLPIGPTREAQLARVQHLKEYRGEDRIISSLELIEAMKDEPEQVKVVSDFPGLEKLTGGFTYEQLVIVSAQEKTGKTSWMLQLITSESMKAQNPCCFLFEQSPREIIRQMAARGQEIPFFYAPASNVDNSMKWIKERALEAMVKCGSRVFVIDNVDWVEKNYESHNQRSDEAIKNLLLDLKTFCKNYGVIIFLIAHVRKLGKQEIPQPNDIKDTAAFKQIADTVIILWRKTIEQKVDGTKTKSLVQGNDTLLWVAENRRTGKIGYVQLSFDGKVFKENVWDSEIQANQDANDIMCGSGF